MASIMVHLIHEDTAFTIAGLCVTDFAVTPQHLASVCALSSCVCRCAYMCVQVNVYVWTRGGQRLTFAAAWIFSDRVSDWDLGFGNLARLAGKQASGILRPPTTQHQHPQAHYHTRLVTSVLEMASSSCGKHIANGVISPESPSMDG